VGPEDIASASLDELANIQGFEPAIAEELQTRASEYVERKHEEIRSRLKELKVADDLQKFEYITLEMLKELAENKILTLDDLAELDNTELFELIGKFGLDGEEEAGDIIMAARAHWFEDEDDAKGDAEAGAEDGTEATAEDGTEAAADAEAGAQADSEAAADADTPEMATAEAAEAGDTGADADAKATAETSPAQG